MLATDLDGTLLDSHGRLSDDNLAALHALEEAGICRILATGRSMFSLKRALPGLLPVDYVIFSTGVGIFDMKTQQLIHKNGLPLHQIKPIIQYLQDLGLSFMLHDPVPENHRFAVYKADAPLHPDFGRRMSYYPQFWRWLHPCDAEVGEAAQFLVVLDNDMAHFERIVAGLDGVKVIRTTSPIDHASIWLEIFPKEVSKGKALQTLMNIHDIQADEVLALGNDYNDVDMLEVAGHSFVTANAPEALKARWPIIAGNDFHALSEICQRIL